MHGRMKTRVVGISLPVDVIEEAMQLGLHLPTICEQAIRNEIKRNQVRFNTSVRHWRLTVEVRDVREYQSPEGLGKHGYHVFLVY